MSPDRQRVLVVEDDEDVSDAIAGALEDAGYVVSVAENGAVALEHLRAQAALPSLVLLDLMMPVMDGEELLHHLKEEPSLAEIPVVVLTADASVAGAAERLGARAGVRKPISLSELLSVVSAHSA